MLIGSTEFNLEDAKSELNNNQNFSNTCRPVHIVDENHRNRARIAMSVSQSGGIAEIFDSLEELIEAEVASGTILANAACGRPRDLLTRLRRANIFLPLILFAEENLSTTQIVRAAHEGVADILTWPFTGDDILQSSIYCQEFMTGQSENIRRRELARNLLSQLTSREREVLEFMIDGQSNKQMANLLNISPRTVEDYRLNLIKKLGAGASTAAIRIGLEAGI